MADVARQKLAELVGRFGLDLCNDARRSEALLRDVCGEFRREISVLVSAVREGIANEIRNSFVGVPKAALLGRMAKRLNDNLGVEANLARWAVESWALALGVVDAACLAAAESPSALPTRQRDRPSKQSSQRAMPFEDAATPGQDAPPNNVHEQRIQQLLDELESAPLTFLPDSPRDKQIQEAKAALASYSKFAFGNLLACPACKADLTRVSGQMTGMCPVCNAGRLKRRKLDRSKCPVCRSGQLVDTVLDQAYLFCPVCESAPLGQERRKRFGLPVDVWWVCGACRAEFDAQLGGKVEFVRFNSDPFGFGAKYRGYTFSTDEWQEVVPRTQLECKCGSCEALFYGLDDDSLTLVGVNSDPFGSGDKWRGKSFNRRQWSKIAYGGSPKDGNVHCPHCAAEFDFEAASKTIALRSYDRESYPGIDSWFDDPIDVQQWYLMLSGKQSLKPGWLCSKCETEFDDESPEIRLVRTPANKLQSRIRQSMLPADWQRCAAGVPTSAEQQQLLGEVQRLKELKRDELAFQTTSMELRRMQVENELAALYRQSFLAGCLPIQTTDPRAKIPGGEVLRWESRSLMLKQRSRRGMSYWASDSEGTLVLTDDRLLFVDQARRWQRALGKLVVVETEALAGNPPREVIVLRFDGLQKPVGFIVVRTSLQVSRQGHACEFTIGSDDFVQLLRRHC